MASLAILGGGNGGFAAAAHHRTQGHEVRLYSRHRETVEEIAGRGRLEYEGILGEGTVPVRATSDLAEALRGADLVMVCAPTSLHEGHARALAPLLRDGQVVLLNPGHTGGALQLRQVLRSAGCTARVVIGETNTLTYICRKTGPARIGIWGVLRNVRMAALPSRRLPELKAAVQPFYPDLLTCATVLETSLCNINAVLHPPGMVLGAAWIERTGGDFTFYQDGATPAVGRVMDALDRERLRIGRAWGLALPDFPSLFASLGSTTEAAGRSGSSKRAMLESAPNRGIKAPSSLDHRYVHEDVGFGLVPWAALADLAGARAPVMDALITLASTMNGVDYRGTGLTLERMGLAGLGREEALARVRDDEIS